MAASLDGFIARKDGSVDWLETSDEFAGGETMDPGFVEAFLKTIDCYVMGSRTYETALRFESQGFGWSYGSKPTFVLTRRDLPRTRDTVSFVSGDLAQLVNERLRPRSAASGSSAAACFAANAFASGSPTKFVIRSADLDWQRGFVFREARQRRRAPPGGGHSLQERHGVNAPSIVRHGGASLRGAIGACDVT